MALAKSPDMWRGSTEASLARTRSAADASGGSAQRDTKRHAQRHRLDLVAVQHDRRQVEAVAQHIADPGLALDRHAGHHQVGDMSR